MRTQFPGYYRPKEEEFESLWKECIFVFDANVLLNFYRYSDNSRTILFDIFKVIESRLWIPYQAALEYHKNRLLEINKQESTYGKIIDILDKKLNENSEINQYSKHHKIDFEEIKLKMNELFHELEKSVKDQQMSNPSKNIFDEISENLADILEGKVGFPFSNQQLKDIYEEGEIRYKQKIPPGFEDAKEKKGVTYFQELIIEDKFGDLILWKETINKAIEAKKPIIFVTDDGKSDWWFSSNGKTVGPHPSLIHEMKSKAKTSFYMYQTDQFIKFSEQYLKIGASQKNIASAVEEVKEIRESNEEEKQNYETTYINKNNHVSTVDSVLLDNVLIGFPTDHMESFFRSVELFLENDISVERGLCSYFALSLDLLTKKDLRFENTSIQYNISEFMRFFGQLVNKSIEYSNTYSEQIELTKHEILIRDISKKSITEAFSWSKSYWSNILNFRLLQQTSKIYST